MAMLDNPRLASRRRFLEACAATRAALREAKALGLEGKAFLDFVSKKGLSNLACALLVKAKLEAGAGPGSNARFVGLCEEWGIGDVVSVLVTKCSLEAKGDTELFHKLALEAGLDKLVSVKVAACSLAARGDTKEIHALATKEGLHNLVSVVVAGCSLAAGGNTELYHKLAVEAGLDQLVSVKVAACSLAAGDDTELFHKLAVYAGLHNLVTVIAAEASIKADGDMEHYVQLMKSKNQGANATVVNVAQLLEKRLNRLVLLRHPATVPASLREAHTQVPSVATPLTSNDLLAAVPFPVFLQTLTDLGFTPPAQQTTSAWENIVSTGFKEATVELAKGPINLRVAECRIYLKKPCDSNSYFFVLTVIEGVAPSAGGASSSSSTAAAGTLFSLTESVRALEPDYVTPTDMPSARKAPVRYAPPA